MSENDRSSKGDSRRYWIRRKATESIHMSKYALGVTSCLHPKCFIISFCVQGVQLGGSTHL